jgi:predicted HNH restriction endonuclease
MKTLKDYKLLFRKYWGYGEQDTPMCWGCYRKPAVDIHHLISKKMGGVKNNRLNRIDNLFPVCRSCHTIAHQHKDINEQWKVHLREKIDNKEYEENNGD